MSKSPQAWQSSVGISTSYAMCRWGLPIASIMWERSIGQVDDDTIAGKKELASWGSWGFVRIGPWSSFYPGSWFMNTRWWFKYFLFSPLQGRFPFELIFFRWVETTNQNIYDPKDWISWSVIGDSCVKMLPAPGWWLIDKRTAAGWCRKHQESHEQDGDWVEHPFVSSYWEHRSRSRSWIFQRVRKHTQSYSFMFYIDAIVVWKNNI